MIQKQFQTYLSDFEAMVSEGIRTGQLGTCSRISINQGHLACSDFGKLMGLIIDDAEPFSLNYYGLKKFSYGLVGLIELARRESKGSQLRFVEVIEVSFASIRYEDIILLRPELVIRFMSFKSEVLKARGFNGG
jgi:hypothetical protein